MTRSEYIRAAKARALELLEAGDPAGAVNGLGESLNARPDTFIHPELMWLAVMHLKSGHVDRVRSWITSFPES